MTTQAARVKVLLMYLAHISVIMVPCLWVVLCMISTSVEPELLQASTIDSTCSGEVIVHREVGLASSQRDAVVMSTRSVLEVRATMVWSLATSVQIWLTGARPFLTHDERSESCALLRLHLISYQWLAVERCSVAFSIGVYAQSTIMQSTCVNG